MQSMFRDFPEMLGLPAGMEADFDESIARNREFLASSAELTLGNVGRAALPPQPAVDEDGEPLADAGPMEEVSFDVKVVNQAGHRLPSGYHSRRVYLHVTVTDENGDQLFESGRIEPDGRIRGVAEDIDPDAWEPHYDVITKASQVQVWQAIVGREDGDRTHSLLAGDRYLKDNRILPKGFFKAEAIDNPDDGVELRHLRRGSDRRRLRRRRGHGQLPRRGAGEHRLPGGGPSCATSRSPTATCSCSSSRATGSTRSTSSARSTTGRGTRTASGSTRSSPPRPATCSSGGLRAAASTASLAGARGSLYSAP